MSYLKVLVASILVSTSLWADQAQVKARMHTEVDTIANVFRTMYAPREWKKKFAGWDIDEEVQLAKDRITAKDHVTVKDFQEIIRDFVQSTQDYHVSIRFYSTESASLPIEVKSVKGRYFIVYVDRAKLPFSAFPFSTGDELLTLNGVSAGAATLEIKAEIGNNVGSTDQALAERMLTKRSGASGMRVPQGPVELTILRQGAQVPVTHQLMWEYQPEKIASFSTQSPADFPFTFAKQGMEDLKMETPLTDILGSDNEAGNPYTLGGRESYIPTLGVKIWESEKSNSFHAYIFQDSKKRLIGYIRIPSYSAGESTALEFAELITRMQRVTEALVIDQINNPGGSVFYLYTLASMFSDKAIYAPLHRVALDQSMIAGALSNLKELENVKNDDDAKKALGSTTSGYPITYQFALFLKQYAQFQVDEWNAGRRLTKPVHLWGVEKINPHPSAHYTKPVLLMVNELDFSGGDFFPAILQDNKLVTVMGTRTAGAGGYVLQQKYTNSMGVMTFTTTGSVAERVNSNPIENLGVVPDIPYELTVADVQNGCQDYVKAILGAVDSLIK